MRKWLNIRAKDSDYSADPDSDFGSGSDTEQELCEWPRQSRLNDAKGIQVDIKDALPRIRRRKSETFRAQYINTKKLKDLELDSWLDVNEPADIYVIGSATNVLSSKFELLPTVRFQEVIPLNAGNIFGAEDSCPISVWEDIIRESMNKVPPVNKFKSFSDPPSPSRLKPSEDAPDIEEESPLNLTVRLDRLYFFRPDEDEEEGAGESNVQFAKQLTKTLGGTERIGLCWPERPLDLLGQHVSERPGSFKSMKSFKASKSFKTYSSFKLNANGPNRTQSDTTLLAELDLEALINRK
ncbi:type IV inositol polyphosphate 5-phosphatase 3-like [Nicotiana tabacum]|uniref:Type IV inositol polyphosphate 5-phosphatase 3-like n=1 Tax=Nicotiana tabacum TaxID=4097 RepID=A0AC58T2Y9_TOBAC